MPLKVNPTVAMRWVESRMDVRIQDGEPHKARVRVCPSCGNEKWATGFDSKMQLFHCFRCLQVVRFLDLVGESLGESSLWAIMQHLAEYGSLDIQWRPPRREDEDISPGDVIREALEQAGSARRAVRGTLVMDGWSTDWQSVEGARIMAYALRRNVPQWFIESGRLGYFTGKHPLRGRLTFLVYESGQPVYAVGRAITDGVEPKYLYPVASLCGGRTAGDVVFNLDLLRPGQTALICEGVLSALSAGAGGLATLGKGMTATQATKIAMRRPGCAVWLREQGVSPHTALERASLLTAKGVPVLMAQLVDGDTNDNPDQLPEVLAKAEAVTPASALLARLQVQHMRPARRRRK